MSLKLQVIICSTRPGRLGESVGHWFYDFAKSHSHFEVELVDLAQVNLPMYDEPKHPVMQQYQNSHTKSWSETVHSADAFVFVTPEYNYSPTPALVNALNYVYHEWSYKPCAFVSYGGISGGLRAAQIARLHVTTMKMMPIPEGVAIPSVGQQIDRGSGQFHANELIDKAATDVLHELEKWARGLKAMRTTLAK